MEVKYHNLKTMSLLIFIDCLCNNDYSGLLISGKATDEQLKAKWNELYLDYFELSNETDEYKTYLNYLKSFAEKYSRHLALISAYEVLRTKYNDDIKNNLMKLGYIINPDNKTEIELKKLETHIKNAQTMLTMAEVELNKYLEKQTKEKITEQNFMKYVSSVSQFMGFSIPLNTTVFQFASYSNLYIKSNGRGQNR